MIMRLLFLLFILLPFQASAQDLASPMQESRFRFGVNGSLNGVVRRAVDIRREGDHLRNLQLESGGAVVSNLMIGYALNDRFDLEAGVGYAYMTMRRDASKMVFETNFIGQPITPPQLLGRELHFVEIPVQLTHTVGNSLLRFIYGAGLTTSYLYRSERSFLGSTSVPDEVHMPDHQIHFFATLHGGLAFHLSSKSDLRLEGNYRLGFSKVDELEYSTRLRSIGIGLGYYKRF